MKKFKFFALLLSVVALTFASCKKDEEPEEPVSSETTYILGTYNTESFLMTNGQIHYFDRTDNTVFAALDMAVTDNNDVYVVGEIVRPGVSVPPLSALYKNNVECPEYTFEPATFCGIALKENGDILLAGLYNGVPAVWDGTQRTNLPFNLECEVLDWDIASIEYVNGNELIVGTYMVDDAQRYHPVIWLNREFNDLNPMDGASTFAFDGAFISGTNYTIGGINMYPDNSRALGYLSQRGHTDLPYQWTGSNAAMVYGVVNSSKWNDPSRTIYYLVTEYYEHGHINPITGEIGALDSINGGFYLVKNGEAMPETKFKYPKDNTLASVIDMSMNSKGQIVLVGSLFDNEDQTIRPAYWVNGECHIINPDRRFDDGVASRIIIKSTKK